MEVQTSFHVREGERESRKREMSLLDKQTGVPTTKPMEMQTKPMEMQTSFHVKPTDSRVRRQMETLVDSIEHSLHRLAVLDRKYKEGVV